MDVAAVTGQNYAKTAIGILATREHLQNIISFRNRVFSCGDRNHVNSKLDELHCLSFFQHDILIARYSNSIKKG